MASLFTWLTAPGTAIVENEIESLSAPSAEENATFVSLTTHWLALEAWGASKGGLDVVAPSAHLQHEAWIKFRDAWVNGKPDVTKMQAASLDLYNAEQVAMAMGYQNPFDGKPVPTPDIATATPLLDAARKADEAAKAASAAAATLVKKTPWWAYAGAGGAAIVAVGVGVLILRNSPQARIARAL